jgi:carbonic anhydrase/acetyltransferase-like protein (isoleucine patch superfamily)
LSNYRADTRGRTRRALIGIGATVLGRIGATVLGRARVGAGALVAARRQHGSTAARRLG